MLAITGDGRRAALDLRLIGLVPDPDGGRISALTDRQNPADSPSSQP